MRKVFLLLCALLSALCALPAAAGVPAPTDLDSITQPLTTDYSQAAQLPLTGYFTKSFPDGRTMKVYISPEASIRTYFTVIALPNGTDASSFLESNGWLSLIDAKGEALVILEPGANGWGNPETEAEYINSAMRVVRSGRNGNNIPVMSSFGEFYLAGYGEGAAPLEYWAASNPILVISQVYADGKSDPDALAKAGAPLYDGRNTSGYDPGFTNDDDFLATLDRTGISRTAKKDVPVPTWLINYSDDSASANYWRYANDCEDENENGTYWQKKDSKRPQTLYANSQITGPHGFSQVKLSTGSVPNAQELYAWLSNYTRYDVTFSYANALAYRLDYTAARVGAQRQAKDGKAKRTYNTKDWKGNAQTVAVLGEASVEIPTHGTVRAGVFSFSDNNNDGVNDPREYLLYVPEGFSDKKLPVLFIYPGNTQTDGIFFDCTQWYQVADKEGFAAVFVCETYSSPVSVTHVHPYEYHTAILEILRQDVDGKLASLDFTRVYGTGQSMGSMTTQDMARVNPGVFAAVASTSGNTYALVNPLDFGQDPSSDKPIPTMMLTGQSDLPGLMPDLGGSEALRIWANYFLKVNGLNASVRSKDDKFGADVYVFVDRRHEVYLWSSEEGIPLFAWGMTLLRPHNCYPAEMPILWKFMKHFALKEDGRRVFSFSAFTVEGDEVVLF